MYATGTAKEVAMVYNEQGRYLGKVLGGSGGRRKWRDWIAVEVVTWNKL